MAKDRSLDGNKGDITGLAPKNKQAPGGTAGPDSKIRGAKLHDGSTGSLMGGMSSYRGKGGNK